MIIAYISIRNANIAITNSYILTMLELHSISPFLNADKKKLA